MSISAASIHVVTGGRDSIVRIWKIFGEKSDMGAFDLWQELEGHQNYITAIVKTRDQRKFYSSDWNGTIIEWMQTNGDTDSRDLYSLLRFCHDVYLEIIIAFLIQ